jgi:hypothetical protein
MIEPLYVRPTVLPGGYAGNFPTGIVVRDISRSCYILCAARTGEEKSTTRSGQECALHTLCRQTIMVRTIMVRQSHDKQIMVSKIIIDNTLPLLSQ